MADCRRPEGRLAVDDDGRPRQAVRDERLEDSAVETVKYKPEN
jgi:hypothetical protein